MKTRVGSVASFVRSSYSFAESATVDAVHVTRRGAVDRQGPDDDALADRRLRAAQDGLDPGHELLVDERPRNESSHPRSKP